MSKKDKKIQYWTYKRQYLGKRGINVEQVLRDVIGVYSSHPSAPLSLYARVSSFDERAFRQLDKNRLAFRVPAMRLTVYMLPRETAKIIFSATIPPASNPIWEKRYSQKNRFISREDYENWKKEILRLADKPLTVEEIKKFSGIPNTSVKRLKSNGFRRKLVENRSRKPSLKYHKLCFYRGVGCRALCSSRKQHCNDVACG